jgi:hypothetical protein
LRPLVALLLGGVALYILLPSLLSLFGSWRSLSHLDPLEAGPNRVEDPRVASRNRGTTERERSRPDLPRRRRHRHRRVGIHPASVIPGSSISPLARQLRYSEDAVRLASVPE